MGRSVVEIEDQITADFVGVDFFVMLLDDTRSQFEFTANTTTNVITATSHDYIDGTPIQVSVSGGGTLPAPLVAGTTYYVRDVAVNTFKLSATSGGSVIDITTVGTGTFLVTDLALSVATRTIAEIARKEISSYEAITNRPLINFSNPVVTSDTTVSLTQQFTLDNSSGSTDLPSINALCLVRDGSATPFNTTGKPAAFNRLLSTVVVLAGELYSIRIPITATIPS